MSGRLYDKFKTNGKQKITAVIFVLLIFSMLFGMFINAPAVGEEFLTTYRANVLPGSSGFERFTGAIAAADTSAGAGVLGRPQYIELYGLTQLIMNKKIVIDPNYGAIYKTPDGQLAYAVEEEYLGGYLDNMYALVNTLAQSNIPLLYVQAPFKLRDARSGLPPTVTNYSTLNAGRFLDALSGANVYCLDLRASFENSGMAQKDMFYDTDHHWTIDAAFFGTAQIVTKLNADFGFNIDESLFDIDNYIRKTFRDFYIGSIGRRVGRIYGGIDDFTLITPNFQTDISYYKDGEAQSGGSFEDAVLSRRFIDEKLPPSTNRYAVYPGDYSEMIFINHLVDCGKILIIKDSFGVPVYSFLSLGAHEVRAVDMRLFTKDISEYAAEFRPDIVIILYNEDCFTDQLFDFKEKPKR